MIIMKILVILLIGHYQFIISRFRNNELEDWDIYLMFIQFWNQVDPKV